MSKKKRKYRLKGLIGGERAEGEVVAEDLVDAERDRARNVAVLREEKHLRKHKVDLLIENELFPRVMATERAKEAVAGADDRKAAFASNGLVGLDRALDDAENVVVDGHVAQHALIDGVCLVCALGVVDARLRELVNDADELLELLGVELGARERKHLLRLLHGERVELFVLRTSENLDAREGLDDGDGLVLEAHQALHEAKGALSELRVLVMQLEEGIKND